MNYPIKLAFALLVLPFCAASVSAADQVVGYRYDGSGIYPDQAPVAFWKKDRNVIWSTPMPGRGNGTPIVVGERVITTAEPDKLICVNKRDGKILWVRNNPPESVLTEEQRIADEGAAERREALQKEIGDGYREYRRLGRKARKAADPAAVEKEREELQQKLADLQTEMDELPNYFKANTHPENGFCSQTPVSDGEFIYYQFGSGITVCYDLEGNRKWGVFVEHANDGRGQGASPVLIQDKLIVHYNNLVALNAETGEQLWKNAEARANFGSPVVTTIGHVEVVVTGNGDIVRVSGGELLASKIFDFKFGSPIVDKNVVYRGDRDTVVAVELSFAEDDSLVANTLWKTTVKTNGEKRSYGGPVLHEGKLYTSTDKGMFTVLDAKTGDILNEQALALGDRIYDMVSAGDMLYIAAGSGNLLTMSTEGSPSRIATNNIGRFFGSPSFDDSRLYLRTFTHLYCIGRNK